MLELPVLRSLFSAADGFAVVGERADAEGDGCGSGGVLQLRGRRDDTAWRAMVAAGRRAR